ncbi:hypothetical protein ACJ41O_006730 [Fusarium nematophilum]
MPRPSREASAESIVVATSPKDPFSSMAPHSNATIQLACAKAGSQLKERQPLTTESIHLLQQCYIEHVPNGVNLLPPSYFECRAAAGSKSRVPSPSGDRLLSALRSSKFPGQWMAVNIERDSKEKRLVVSDYDPSGKHEHRIAALETIRSWAIAHHPGWKLTFSALHGPETTSPCQSGLHVVTALKEMVNKLALPASRNALAVRTDLSDALARYLNDKTAESPQSDDSGVFMDGDSVDFPMDISDDSSSSSACSDSPTSGKAKSSSKSPRTQGKGTSEAGRSRSPQNASSKAKDPKLVARRGNPVPQLKAVPQKEKLVRDAVTASAQKQASARLATLNGGVPTPASTPSGKGNLPHRVHSSQPPSSSSSTPSKTPNLQLPPRPGSSFTESHSTPQSNGTAKSIAPPGSKSPPSPSTGKRMRSLFNDGPGDASQPSGKKPRRSMTGRESLAAPPLAEPDLDAVISRLMGDMTSSKELEEVNAELHRDRDTAEDKLNSVRAHHKAVHEEYAREMASFNRITDDLAKYERDVEEDQKKAEEWFAQCPLARLSPAQRTELCDEFKSKALGFTQQHLGDKERQRREVDMLLKNEIQPKCDQAAAMVQRKEAELKKIGEQITDNENRIEFSTAQERYATDLKKIKAKLPPKKIGGS